MIRPENVPVTVDVIIEIDNKIVLIERKNYPAGYALPGGFVEAGESLAQAAVREAKEETGLDVKLIEQFFAYSKPGRDPRGPVVSVVFIGQAKGVPVGADDAKRAILVNPSDLPNMAFDHADIVEDYLEYVKYYTRPFPEE